MLVEGASWRKSSLNIFNGSCVEVAEPSYGLIRARPQGAEEESITATQDFCEETGRRHSCSHDGRPGSGIRQQ